jgi:hypothetical protein
MRLRRARRGGAGRTPALRHGSCPVPVGDPRDRPADVACWPRRTRGRPPAGVAGTARARHPTRPPHFGACGPPQDSSSVQEAPCGASTRRGSCCPALEEAFGADSDGATAPPHPAPPPAGGLPGVTEAALPACAAEAAAFSPRRRGETARRLSPSCKDKGRSPARPGRRGVRVVGGAA